MTLDLVLVLAEKSVDLQKPKLWYPDLIPTEKSLKWMSADDLKIGSYISGVQVSYGSYLGIGKASILGHPDYINSSRS